MHVLPGRMKWCIELACHAVSEELNVTLMSEKGHGIEEKRHRKRKLQWKDTSLNKRFRSQ